MVLNIFCDWKFFYMIQKDQICYFQKKFPFFTKILGGYMIRISPRAYCSHFDFPLHLIPKIIFKWKI